MKTVALAILIALVAWIFLGPVLSMHLWWDAQTSDGYPYAMEMFKDSFAHGNWYPRWFPKLAGGYGYPMMVYYHPGLFFLVLPFTYLFSSVVVAFYAALLLCAFTGGVGVYLLARLFCNRPASILCLGLFFTSHYLAGDFFGRGDLPEYVAMLLPPWGVYLFLRITDGIQKRNLPLHLLIAFTGVTFALTIMHPFVFFYCIPVVVAMMMGKWVESGYNTKMLLIPALCIAMALALSAPYWVTLLQMKEFVQYHGATFVSGRAKNMTLFFDDAYFTPGKVHFTLAMLGWLCAWRQVFFRYVFGAYLFLIFLMTPYADFIWRLDTPLNYTQFPWRVNSLLVTLQLLGIIQLARCATPLVGRHFPTFGQPGFWGIASMALLPLFVFDINLTPHFSIKYADPFITWKRFDYESYKKEEERKGFRFVMIYREFDPVTADYSHLPNRLVTKVPLVVPTLPHIAISMMPGSNPYLIRFIATTNNPSGFLPAARINQMALPGWQVTVDGKPATFVGKGAPLPHQPSWGIGDHGRIRVNFPEAKKYTVMAWYEGPPGWRERNAVIVILILALGYALYWQRRHINLSKSVL